MAGTHIGAIQFGVIAAWRNSTCVSLILARPAGRMERVMDPCFMVGGERATVATLEPILRALATNQGYVYAGPPGSGHFVKLVHNGIEFGMLRAIAEGFDLLTHYHERLDIGAVLECWRHGSVIRSWLLDLLTEAYRDDPTLQKETSYIEDTGEVNWLLSDAISMEVATPAISTAVMQLIASRDQQKNWARAIVLMRHGFGGHPLGPNEATAHERQTGRVGRVPVIPISFRNRFLAFAPTIAGGRAGSFLGAVSGGLVCT
jgi:6-phosphogluconate dehydrogenase